MNSLFKASGSICLQNLRKWKTDYRVWTIAALLTIMVGVYVDDMKKIATGLGTEMPVWIFPFMYSQFHTKLIFTFPLILLLCNAPFVDGNQVFVYLRTGRVKWLCGQMLYIASASALYYIFLFVVSILSTVFYGGDFSDWGKTLMTTSITNAPQIFNAPFIEIPPRILDFFAPIQAVWFTFLMSWLCGIIIGLILFLCNYLTGTRFVGLTITSGLLALTVPVRRGLWKINYLSPFSWNTLDCIDTGEVTQLPSFSYCLTVYLVLIAMLIAAIFIFGSRKSLDVKEDD